MPNQGLRERRIFFALFGLIALVAIQGCSKQSDDTSSCPTLPTEQIAGSTGKALVFLPDPAMSAKNPNLDPQSDLDAYRVEVPLSRLSGKGVLQGEYVDVRSHAATQNCSEEYGALSPTNDFEFSERDPRFQEAMSYYFGDSYQAALNDAGVEVAKDPIHIIAHCGLWDNAFFHVLYGPDGSIEEQVCLGDSLMTPGAHYADDGYVIVHELQHATTMRHYSLTQWLGDFYYDEAGAVNEGISDFMALMYLSPSVPAGFDPRTFSSWALGTFNPNDKLFRGAARCPIYDRNWPNCDSFPTFSLAGNHVSYVYPDGLGWPYSDNYSVVKPKVNALSYAYSDANKEEIHNNAIIIEGALWDTYQALLSDHGDVSETQRLMMKLVAKAIEDLPKPDSENLSPVTFREFASSVLYVAKAMNLSAEDYQGIIEAFTNRGLVGGPLLDSSWAVAGTGTAATPGIRVEDNPRALSNWLEAQGQDTSIVAGNSSANGKLDPGETAVVWFDLKDVSRDGTSAGGVTLTVTAEDPHLSFVPEINRGWISEHKVQVQYAKVNGDRLVNALTSTIPNDAAFTGDDYFLTNPQVALDSGVGGDFTTGIWLRVSASAAHGQVVRFRVDATPSNGATSTTYFNATIQ